MFGHLRRSGDALTRISYIRNFTVGKQTLTVPREPETDSRPSLSNALLRLELDENCENWEHADLKLPKRRPRLSRFAECPVPMVARYQKMDLDEKQRDLDYPNPAAPHAYIDFRRFENPRDILDALHDAQDYVQMRQIVAALTRCRSAGFDLHLQALQSILDLAARTIGSTRKDDVVGLFLSGSRFKNHNRPHFFNDVAKLAIERGYVKEMTIREIATMIHACGALMRRAEKTVGSWFQETSAPRSKAPTGFEKHRELASGMPQVENLLDVLIEEIATLRKPDDEFELRLPSILKSLSFLGRDDVRLDRVIEGIVASMHRSRGLSEDRMAALVFSIANSGSINRDLVDQVAIEVTKRQRLESFSAAQIVGIVHAFSQLNVRNRGMWMAIFMELTDDRRLQELTRKQIIISMKALAATGIVKDDEEIMARLAMETFSHQRLREFSAKEVIELTGIVKNRKHRLPIDGMAIVRKVSALQTLSDVKRPVLLDFVQGLAVFDLQWAEKFSRSLQRITRPDRLTLLSPYDIRMILVSAVRRSASA